MSSSPTGRRPNILLITSDQHRGDAFGFEGRPVHTPHLDLLAAEGTRFAACITPNVVCQPARASLLTGRYPHRTGVVDTTEMRGLDRMAPSEVTIAQLLGAAGYATGLVGKWHNGALDPRHHPTTRGFAEFAGFCGGWSPYFGWTIERGTSPATQSV